MKPKKKAKWIKKAAENFRDYEEKVGKKEDARRRLLIYTFLIMIAGHVFHIKESRLHPSPAQEFLDSGGPADPGQVDGAAGEATVVGILLVFQGDAQQRRDQKVSIQRKDGTDLGKVEDIASRPKRHVSVQTSATHPIEREGFMRLFSGTKPR